MNQWLWKRVNDDLPPWCVECIDGEIPDEIPAPDIYRYDAKGGRVLLCWTDRPAFTVSLNKHADDGRSLFLEYKCGGGSGAHSTGYLAETTGELLELWHTHTTRPIGGTYEANT